MPEDDGLESQPIIDHYEGDFTSNLIVGPPGEDIVLRNSDSVGHTISAEANGKRLWRSIDMKVEIFGMGCPNCSKLEENVRKALAEEGLEAEVVKMPF